MGIYGIYVFLDHGNEETFTETSHDVGCKTTVADYGSPDDPPSCVDCSPLVGITPIEWKSADRCTRCVGSCTAHLEELVDPSDLMQGVGRD
jgi:hypothetical protein